MGVMAYPLRYALADLALALSRVAENAAEVQATAARAAADMIGDGAGVQLLREDGRYAPISYHHLDGERQAPRDRGDELPDDDLSTTMSASRRPVVLTSDHPDGLTGLPGVHAAVLCPVIVDNTYAGYLLLTRSEPGSVYSPAEVELARDIAGELALACGTARARERLKASEERYRRVLETIPEGVLQLDSEGVATYANEPIGVVLGLPRAQLIGVSLRGFLDDQGQSELTRRLAECKAGRSTVGATRLMRADGSQRSVRMSMMPLSDDQGRYSGVVCMVTDTTDHIDARGLKRQLDHLRRLDSLGQLIGGISHDFNNLLTVVAGSADMILTTADEGTPHHQLAADILEAVST